jgi:hypothetical protein
VSTKGKSNIKHSRYKSKMACAKIKGEITARCKKNKNGKTRK